MKVYINSDIKPDLRICWDIIIDNHSNGWNIKPSTRHVSVDKDITLSSLKLIQGSKSFRLSHMPWIKVRGSTK